MSSPTSAWSDPPWPTAPLARVATSSKSLRAGIVQLYPKERKLLTGNVLELSVCNHISYFQATVCSRTWRSVHVGEEAGSGEGGVHVAVDVGGAAEQHEPHLVAGLQREDGAVGGRGPVRDALGPDGGHHAPVDHQVHRRLKTSPHSSATRHSRGKHAARRQLYGWLCVGGEIIRS